MKTSTKVSRKMPSSHLRRYICNSTISYISALHNSRSNLGAPKTTTHSEGWHGRLNAASHHNPNMWTFWEILKVEITLVGRELLDYRLGQEKRKRTYINDLNKRLKNLCDRRIPEADEEKYLSTPLHV